MIPAIALLRNCIQIKSAITAISLGFTLAGVHTIGQFFQIFNPNIQLFVGEVSEGGQLALIVPWLITWRVTKGASHKYLLITLPIIIGALIFNLKRGPWFGVTATLFLLAFSLKHRKILRLLLPTLLISYLIPAVKLRVDAAITHFMLAGGRQEIWEAGFEIIKRYPLGVGFENSRFFHFYTYYVPENLTHLHCNILNIIVESGFIGGSLYLFWLIAAGRELLTYREEPLALATFLAIFSWQLAGLVEYNFGDSEVLYLAFALLGLSSQVTHSKSTDPQLKPAPTTATAIL
jgi:O-antigen ligase